MSSPGTFSETDVQYRLLNCSIQSSRPATLPRRTVIEALGRVNVVCEARQDSSGSRGIVGVSMAVRAVVFPDVLFASESHERHWTGKGSIPLLPGIFECNADPLRIDLVAINQH